MVKEVFGGKKNKTISILTTISRLSTTSYVMYNGNVM